MAANHLDGMCDMGCCREPAAAVLGPQTLCLNHFVAQCYRQLDELDPRGRQIPAGALELALRMTEIEECSNQALRVCLAEEKLTNLNRGRLLDILLWAGELYILLRQPHAHGIGFGRWAAGSGPEARSVLTRG
jgi:hypothetical protein